MTRLIKLPLSINDECEITSKNPKRLLNRGKRIN